MKEELNITIIQSSLHWENRTANLANFTNIFAQFEKMPDIIVLPETFTTGFSMNRSVAESDQGTIAWMCEMAEKYQVAIAGSYFIEEKNHCYNRFHFVEPGNRVTIYNKKHLFRLTNEQDVVTPGNQQVIVEYKGWTISLMVCYDLRFPVWMRRSEVNNYDMILLVANWPERRSYAWNHLLVARAIENQSYVVAANRTGSDGTGILYGGESVVIDPRGHYIEKGLPFTEQVIHGKIKALKLQEVRNTLPFYNDRDLFSLT